MISKRIARLFAAASFAAFVGFVTSVPQGAVGQTTDRPAGRVEVTDCVVKFHRRAELATDRPGIIAQMPFDEGSAIAVGDLVVRLRDDVPAANLALSLERAESRTAIGMAEKEAAAAAVELASAERANQNLTVVPASTVERLRLVKDARDIAVTRAQEEVSLNSRAAEQAQAELDSFRILSQQSGIVTRVLKREGEAVQQGEAVIEVVDPSVARVEGKLHINQARRLRVGMPVEVRLDFPDVDLPLEDELFVGTLGFIDVSVSEIGHEVRVWAQVENRDGILLEYLPARLTIDVGE